MLTVRESSWLTENTYSYEEVVRMMAELLGAFCGDIRVSQTGITGLARSWNPYILSLPLYLSTYTISLSHMYTHIQRPTVSDYLEVMLAVIHSSSSVESLSSFLSEGALLHPDLTRYTLTQHTPSHTSHCTHIGIHTHS